MGDSIAIDDESPGIGCLLVDLTDGTAADMVAASIFAGTMILLHGVSSLYHAVPVGPAKRWLKRLDHASIDLFTAGSYMLSYTAGAVVYLFDHRIRYAHLVWHLFVMGGSTCHFFATLWRAGLPA